MHYQLVKVIGGSTLLDENSYPCSYRTPDGRPLQQGIYVALWPRDDMPSKYDESARYYGPFGSCAEADDFVEAALVPCEREASPRRSIDLRHHDPAG